MTSHEPGVAAVLSRFDLPRNVVSERHLGGDGLSGSRLWRIQGGGRSWCLKRYAEEYPTVERLTAIHAAVSAASKEVNFLAPPIADRGGATVVEFEQRLWDLTPWLPGASAAVPTNEQVKNAFLGLARLHSAWRDHSWRGLIPEGEVIGRLGPPLGILERLRFLQNLEHSLLRRISTELPYFQGELWFPYAVEIMGQCPPALRTAESVLRLTSSETVSRQVCLRDARAEHFLFVGDELRGVIDYDAVRVDTATADISRLQSGWWELGELALKRGLAAYEAILPLSEADQRTLAAFNVSTRILTGMRWLQWLVVERRTFPDNQAVANRLRRAADGMRQTAPLGMLHS